MVRILLCLAALLLPQTGSCQGWFTPSKYRGVVYDAKTYAPLKGVYVVAHYFDSGGTAFGHSGSWCARTAGTYTGDDGSFTFPKDRNDHLPRQTYAFLSGYFYKDHAAEIRDGKNVGTTIRLAPQDPHAVSLNITNMLELSCYRSAETHEDAAQAEFLAKVNTETAQLKPLFERQKRTADMTADRRFRLDGDTAYDSLTGLTWRRCSLGQTWDPGTGLCTGRARVLDWKGASTAAPDKWRLPSSTELLSLAPKPNMFGVAKEDPSIFPDPYHDFWSSSGTSNMCDEHIVHRFTAQSRTSWAAKPLDLALVLVVQGEPLPEEPPKRCIDPADLHRPHTAVMRR